MLQPGEHQVGTPSLQVNILRFIYLFYFKHTRYFVWKHTFMFIIQALNDNSFRLYGNAYFAAFRCPLYGNAYFSFFCKDYIQAASKCPFYQVEGIDLAGKYRGITSRVNISYRTKSISRNTHLSHLSFHYVKTTNRSCSICNGPLSPDTCTHICNSCCLAPVTHKRTRTTPGLASTTSVTNVDFL
jgi:hypothetical protein